MNKKKTIITSLGNTLEWFDFGLFIFMAPVIGETFFPTASSSTSTMNAFIVFAAGFICRPLGGILFGYYGDTHGRAKTLRVSVLLIGVATLFIGILPSYKQIGILSPILFTILRMAQGLSIGGEYSGVMIYLAESAPQHKRGFITSFAATGANFGFLLATLSYLLLKKFYPADMIAAWAWRLPFILAGLPGLIMIYLRFKLTETKTYQHLQSTHHLVKQPMITALKYAPKQLLKIIGLTCMSSSFYYVFFGYMVTYLNKFTNISLNQALILQGLSLTAMLFFVPLAGIAGDYFTRKRMLIITAVSVLIWILPAFYLLQTKSLPAIILTIGIATLITSMEQGNTLTAVVENCPKNVRYSGIATSYNIGNALFGGSAPLIVTLLTNKISVFAPAGYLIITALITLIAATTLLANNKSLGPVG